MTKKEKRTFLPYHAVNEFMRDDFRMKVLHDVFSQVENCAPEPRAKLIKLVSKGVQIPGFRNSNQAPLGFKIKNSQPFFEKSAEFASVIMECWSQLHPTLRKNVYALLLEEGWKIPALSEDRTILPGFQVDWPRGQSFEQLCRLVRQKYADISESDDEISLMVVWIGNRLPINGLPESDEADQSVNSNS